MNGILLKQSGILTLRSWPGAELKGGAVVAYQDR